MFAAAATFAQMAFDAALIGAKWLATKVLIIAIVATLFPFVLKGVIIWGFDYIAKYGKDMATIVTDYIGTLTAGQYNVDIQLTSVGGYLALQTGLIDYCSIIFTGWGLYWIIAVLAKTTPRAL